MIEVEYSLVNEPSEIPLEGNASAIDDETDRDNENWIRSQLASGNDWAWCDVTVIARARIDGEAFEGRDHLAGCSYLSEQDFVRDGTEGYYPDMKANALDALRAAVAAAVARGEVAKRVLTDLG